MIGFYECRKHKEWVPYHLWCRQCAMEAGPNYKKNDVAVEIDQTKTQN